MTDPKASDFDSFIESLPKPTPAEMAAAYDPGTWVFSVALFKTLVEKGVFTAGDLLRMHEHILDGAKEFSSASEVQRVEAVGIVADWLQDYAAGLGKPDVES